MNLFRSLSVAVALSAIFSMSLIAQETGATCPHAKGAKTCAACPIATASVAIAVQDDECCPIDEAMAKLPKMLFNVGDESACCLKGAEALAAKHEAPIHYVVAEKVYDDHQVAYTALVKSTESYVNEFATPHTCEASGKFVIAGQACDCPVQAGETSKLVKSVMDKVHFTYAIGDKTCHCPNEASVLAKQHGAEVVYVVGDQKTSCELTARYNLAHAKYKAAVEYLAAAPKH